MYSIWPDSEPTKLLYRRGRGPQTPAAKSIFKKSRHLRFGVFIDIWSMPGTLPTAFPAWWVHYRNCSSPGIVFPQPER